jgi:hypothetical protein
MLAVFGLSFAPVAVAEIQIERIFMPEKAAPSSFAIGLPRGVSFCYDPLRCAVDYIWTGGFVDPTPARNGIGKFVDAVKLLGPVIYREIGPAPLRRGDIARQPEIKFKGYTLHAESIEFRYTLDGLNVWEEISRPAKGVALTRRFRIDVPPHESWWYVVDGKAPVELQLESEGVYVLNLQLGPVE